MEPNQTKKVGPIIAGLVILLVIVIVALYIAASRSGQSDLPASANVAGNSAALETIKPITNTADDPQSIQDDLNSAIKGIDSQTI